MLCHWFPELLESVNRSERTRGPRACHSTVHVSLFLESKAPAGCRWKKISLYEQDREKKMHGPLLILAFFVEEEREDKKKLPKAAPGMAEVALTRSPITTNSGHLTSGSHT